MGFWLWKRGFSLVDKNGPKHTPVIQAKKITHGNKLPTSSMLIWHRQGCGDCWTCRLWARSYRREKIPVFNAKRKGLVCTFRGFYQGGSYGSYQSVVVFQKGDFDFENRDFLSSVRTGLMDAFSPCGFSFFWLRDHMTPVVSWKVILHLKNAVKQKTSRLPVR